jgi:hypothetical protein
MISVARHIMRATLGPPASVTITVQPSGTVASGSALTTQPSVTVRDAGAAPLAGVTVTAVLASNTGALTNASATTTANGVASFSGLTFTSTQSTSALNYTLHFTAGSVTSAASNAVTFTVAIGTQYGGGYVAYLLTSGESIGYISANGSTSGTYPYNASVQHGIISAPVDQSSSMVWDPRARASMTATGVTLVNLGSGANNTRLIYATLGSSSNYAAKVAIDYSNAGFTDWYLPSSNELKKLYLNRALIGNNFTATNYAGSVESSTTIYYPVSFVTGTNPSGIYKDVSAYVRAIRAF